MRSLSLFSALAAVAVGVSASHVNQMDKAGYRLRARATGKGLTSPDKPQQTGIVSNCNLWYDVVAGDTCDTIPVAFGITRAQFLSWNPAVSSDCTQNFWVGYAYCVGVGSSPAPTSTPAAGSSGAPGSPIPGAPTFSGIPCTCNKYYTIVSGDTCPTVAAKFGISRDQFLAWNPAVSADCATNFWVGQAYCVGVSGATACPTATSKPTSNGSTSTSKTPPTSSSHATTAGPAPTTPTFPNIACNCNKFYDLGPGDTCPSVQARFGITSDQFLQWNPDVSTNCTFNFYVGFSYCVGVSGSASCSSVSSPPPQSGPTNTLSYSAITGGTSAVLAPRPSSTDWPPQPVQAGIPSNCIQYYQANAGDTCVSIQHRFSHQMTMDQMLQWNPAVGSDCSNLFVNYYYCVSVPTAYTDLPPATTQYTYTLGPDPTPMWNLTSLSALQTTFSGAATPCAILFPAPQNGTCDELNSMVGVPASSLSAWNTGINCASLSANEWYCIASTIATTGDPITTPAPDNSTATGTGPTSGSSPSTTGGSASTSTSSSGVPSTSSGATTKSSSASSTPTTSVTSNSSSTKSTSTTTTAAPTTTSKPASVSTPVPTQTGMVANCNRFYKVESGDACWSISNAAGIDVNKFYSMNPAVGTDCSHLLAGYYVCLAVASDGAPATTITSGTPVAPAIPVTSSSPVASPTTTTTSGGAVGATPLPVQTGMASGCTRFYLVESGDNCSLIATDAGISLSTFYSLNPAVGSSCGFLLAGYYVCIGTGSAAPTTITSGKPVAAPTK
ncbi:hypothetical protein C8A01DRAFT_41650 [Parachaetomium inaequale]|uniref:LysM domain-containing protein n=1 Tax=Parachaetomium inaequale TaxID=2588326 RepID=A0AAN6P6Y4_9PEZI|nr:hypothetical protein C8A01DRAFT_41650 [Parachaetomium inaequale]